MVLFRLVRKSLVHTLELLVGGNTKYMLPRELILNCALIVLNEMDQMRKVSCY